MVPQLKRIHSELQKCRKCPSVCSTPVHGPALDTEVMLVGQAPGVHESTFQKPFAYTAGKTLFKWLGEATGLNEEELRQIIYFAAVARCFPGKAAKGQGDRVPSLFEIENCSSFLKAEMEAIRPRLILAVGKIAIYEVLSATGIKKTTSLNDLVGKKISSTFHGHPVTVIPLPHPSGVSRWPHSETGKKKLFQALKLIASEMRNILE